MRRLLFLAVMAATLAIAAPAAATDPPQITTDLATECVQDTHWIWGTITNVGTEPANIVDAHRSSPGVFDETWGAFLDWPTELQPAPTAFYKSLAFTLPGSFAGSVTFTATVDGRWGTDSASVTIEIQACKEEPPSSTTTTTTSTPVPSTTTTLTTQPPVTTTTSPEVTTTTVTTGPPSTTSTTETPTTTTSTMNTPTTQTPTTAPPSTSVPPITVTTEPPPELPYTGFTTEEVTAFAFVALVFGLGLLGWERRRKDLKL